MSTASSCPHPNVGPQPDANKRRHAPGGAGHGLTVVFGAAAREVLPDAAFFLIHEMGVEPGGGWDAVTGFYDCFIPAALIGQPGPGFTFS